MNRTFFLRVPLTLSLSIIYTSNVASQSIIPNPDTGSIVQQNGTIYNIQGGIISKDGQNLFHSLQQFGLSNGEIANFLSTPNIQNILTRITGGNPSFIDGLLQVTGSQANLYLMNPAGIIFGQNAQLNIPADFIATTANAIGFGNNNWFDSFNNNSYGDLIGNPTQFAFDYGNNGYIVNQANLTLNEGKNLTFLAGSVLNTGSINTSQGSITIASIPQQNTVKISQAGNILSLELEPPRDTQGNILPFTPLSLPELLTGQENKSNLTIENNQVLLNNQAIPEETGITIISGELNTNGQKGGEITLLGNKVGLLSANILANGNNGGGNILIGGDYQGKGLVFNAQQTYTDTNSLISANGIITGDGGKVIVWGDNSTQFYGKISATGGLNGGDGGFVETSGKIGLDVNNAKIDVTANAGNTGIWLLDPSNITILDSSSNPLLGSGIISTLFNTNNNSAEIQKSDIESALNTANVVITTAGSGAGSGDITLNIASNLTSVFMNNLTLTTRRFNNSNSGKIDISGNVTFNLNTVNPESTPLTVSIQNAIDSVASSPSVTINLGTGAYFGSDLSFNNDSVGLWTVNGVNQNNTILLGTGNNSVITVNSGVNINLSNVTVTGGNGNLGGGIYNSGLLDISNLAVSNNSSNYGGGIYNYGSMNITNSAISNNSAIFDGGGIYNYARVNFSSSILLNTGSMNITNSIISNNSSHYGGGIYNSSSMNIISSTISSNFADVGGGGILNTGLMKSSSIILSTGSMNITDSTISNNSSGLNGGGIYNKSSSLINISNSTISNNSAGLNGGGIFHSIEPWNSNSLINITNSTISNNLAGLKGGGIYNDNIVQGGAGDINLINTTISANTADYGGGIYDSTIDSSISTLKYVSIVNNSANIEGGGLYDIYSDSNNELKIYNTLIALNNAPLSPDVFGSSITDGGYNLIGIVDGNTGWNSTTLTGTLTNPLNPLVTALGNYGGLTQTHALLSGSPAINRGTNLIDITTDQRGVNRNNLFDIGAYESSPLIPPTPQPTPQINPDSPRFTLIPEKYTYQPTSEHSGNLALDISLLSADSSVTFLKGTVTFTVLPNQNIFEIFKTPQTVTTDKFGKVLFSLAFDSSVQDYRATVTLENGQNLSVLLSTPESQNIISIINSAENVIQQSFQLSESRKQEKEGNELANLYQQNTQDIDIAKATFTALESGLSDAFTDYFGLPNIPELSVEEAQARLRKVEQETGLKSAVIYAFFKSSNESNSDLQWQYNSKPQVSLQEQQNHDDRLELLVVTSSNQIIQKKLTVTRTQMFKLTNKFLSSITQIPQLNAPRRYLQPSQELYQILIGSIETELQEQGINNLTFIMDDGLRRIPLSALFDGQHFLIEKYSVGMMPSLSLTNTDYNDLKNSQVLAMGSDTFTDQNPLPGVSVEVNTIIQELGKGSSFLNENFTVTNLKNARSQSYYAIIHLATHANFESGELKNSYIQFWDEKLTFDRLPELQLNHPLVDLLVLSACQSASGDRNTELGFAGFAVLAGVKSALGSLWYVNDQGTLALMTDFYTHLKTVTTKAEALRETQVDMIQGRVKFEGNQLIKGNKVIPLPPNLNQGDNIDLSHPYYWSGFMLVGNPW